MSRTRSMVPPSSRTWSSARVPATRTCFPPGKQLAEPYETEFRSHMIDDGASTLEELGTRIHQERVLAGHGQ